MILSILHPSDLSVGNEAAFLHALRLAVAAKSRLCILHSQSSGDTEGTDWSSFPGVRSALVRWGLLESDAPGTPLRASLACRSKRWKSMAAHRFRPCCTGSIIIPAT
jgi:hypothetical protein